MQAAFPVLTRGVGGGVGPFQLTTRLSTVSRSVLAPLQAQLQEVVRRPLPLTEEGLLCSLRVGADLSVPLTIVGACDELDGAHGTEQRHLVVHSPGLPGGFVTTAHELAHGRARLCPPRPSAAKDAPSSSSIGSVCLGEAITKHLATEARGSPPDSASPLGGVVDVFYQLARRRHFSLAGMAQLLQRGALLHPDALRLDFPYQCGGAQASKRYLDTTAEVSDVFGEAMRHGAKVLSRYGVAVSVGVVDRVAALTTPALLWHPSGAPAACLAPMLHACPVLVVGSVKLDYNGPVPGSPLTAREDPRRYMNLTVDNRYDDSLWLTQGLFGVKPGAPWTPPRLTDAPAAAPAYEVVGVGYDALAEEMELFVRDGVTHVVSAAADV